MGRTCEGVVKLAVQRQLSTVFRSHSVELACSVSMHSLLDTELRAVDIRTAAEIAMYIEKLEIYLRNYRVLFLYLSTAVEGVKPRTAEEHHRKLSSNPS
jgi:hypothetical protein